MLDHPDLMKDNYQYDETLINNVINIKKQKVSAELKPGISFLIFLLITIFFIIPIIFYTSYYQEAKNLVELGFYFSFIVFFEIFLIIISYLLILEIYSKKRNNLFFTKVNSEKLIIHHPQNKFKYKNEGVSIKLIDIEKVYWNQNDNSHFGRYFFILMKQPTEKSTYYKVLWYEKKIIINSDKFINVLLKNGFPVNKNKIFNPGYYYKDYNQSEKRKIKWIDFPFERVSMSE